MKLLTFSFLLWSCSIFAQVQKFASDNIADCEGATAILYPGSYILQFPGFKGNLSDLDAFSSIQNVREKNSAWCYYVAPSDGTLSLEAKISDGTVQMIVFQNKNNDGICEGIFDGTTEVIRIIDQPTKGKIGLSNELDENHLAPLELKKDEKVMFLFNTDIKERIHVDFDLNFEKSKVIELSEEAKLTKFVDLTKSKTIPSFKVMVRDIETGKPIIATIEVAGIKNLTAAYNGSDFLFNADKSGLISLKCDAQGYFFADIDQQVSCRENQELTIWLEPLGQGKSIRLEEIEFQPGTSQLINSGEEKLRRLKDFLALNATINIEIQGHVHSTGENTFVAQKISEARAKRIYDFLVENGIDKNRLTTKGYGNTRPIFEKPQFSYEEQANRRVEIKVL